MPYMPKAAATTTPPTPVNPHIHPWSTPLEAGFEGVLLAATLLAEEAAWLVDEPEEEAGVDEEAGAEEEIAEEVEEEVIDAEEDEEADEPEVDDALGVEDKSTVALDSVTDAYAHCWIYATNQLECGTKTAEGTYRLLDFDSFLLLVAG
jgi:hypothetical protein